MEKLIKRRVGLAFQAKLPAIVLGKIIDQVKPQTKPVPKKERVLYWTNYLQYNLDMS